MVREPVEQCGRQLGVAEDGRPPREAQVRRDDQTGPLVELAHEVEQKRPASLAEWQVAELVEDHEIRVHHAIGELAGFATGFVLLERVDELDSRQEPHSPMMVDHRLDADRRGQVCLAGRQRSAALA